MGETISTGDAINYLSDKLSDANICTLKIKDGVVEPINKQCCAAVFLPTESTDRFEVKGFGDRDCLDKIGRILESKHNVSKEEN